VLPVEDSLWNERSREDDGRLNGGVKALPRSRAQRKPVLRDVANTLRGIWRAWGSRQGIRAMLRGREGGESAFGATAARAVWRGVGPVTPGGESASCVSGDAKSEGPGVLPAREQQKVSNLKTAPCDVPLFSACSTGATAGCFQGE
jgi:hypothetical protein